LTLGAQRGWGSTQTLMVLALLLTLAVVLAPALASRVLEKRDGA
jgi:hypothetical protein